MSRELVDLMNDLVAAAQAKLAAMSDAIDKFRREGGVIVTDVKVEDGNIVVEGWGYPEGSDPAGLAKAIACSQRSPFIDTSPRDS